MKAFAAILAAFGLLLWLGVPTDTAPEVCMISPMHDGHLWLCHPQGKWQPVHHPDCPCRDARPPTR
jgi:hypothetical protein